MGVCIAILMIAPLIIAWQLPEHRWVLLVNAGVAAMLGAVMVRTYRHTNARARRHQVLTEAVSELGKRALSVEEPDELLGEALRVAMDSIGADYGTALRRLDGDRVRVAAEIGPDPLPAGVLLPLASSQSYIMSVLESGQPVVCADVRDDPRIAAPASLIERGVISSMAVPVFGPDSTVGVLGLHAETANRFSEHDAAVLQALGTVVATAWVQASHREAITYQALHDAMTGLPNRALFFDRLDHVLRGLTRPSSAVQRGTAVLVMDLDNFKHINDTLGHGTGDEVLIRIAQRLAEVVRPGDTIARLGGDEFALLCDAAPPDDALQALAARLIGHVGQPMDIDGSLISVKMSIGAALTRSPARAISDSSTLMQEADAALYQAKKQGGGYCLFDNVLHHQVRTRVQLETDLHRGLARNEFVVHYQPVRDPASRRIVGVEALVRWRHPEQGLLMPSQFLPVAEQTGLSVPLGMHVLRTACVQMAQWNNCPAAPGAADAGPAAAQKLAAQAALQAADEPTHPAGQPLLWVAVNLSARQLDDPSLPEKVQQALQASGLPPACLHLELTETAVIDTGHPGLQVLRQLRETGATLVLDDFGTGFSSLTHLTRLPIQALKVDRSFVAGIGISERDSAVVASVAALGQQLGLHVIAEGVETPEQLLRVIELDCYGAQGFLLDRPADVQTLEQGALRAVPGVAAGLGPVVGSALGPSIGSAPQPQPSQHMGV